MDALHKVARAYYENGSQEIKSLTQRFFESMDTDRDGRIQMKEFMDFLNMEGYINTHLNYHLFKELDRDRNGVLDFYEFLTLYYIIKTENGFCCQCWRCLQGLYFTCVTCFDCPTSRTFDLCPDCYIASNYRRAPHPHMNFVDSALLLRARRKSSSRSYDPNSSSSSSQAVKRFLDPASEAPIQNSPCQVIGRPQQGPPQAGWEHRKTMMYVLEIALAAGAVGASAFCSIM